MVYYSKLEPMKSGKNTTSGSGLERFDPETWHESLVLCLGLVTVVLGAGYLYQHASDEDTARVTIVLFSIIVTLLAYFIHRQLDAHYEIDPVARLVRFRLFGTLRRQVCRFDEVVAVFLTAGLGMDGDSLARVHHLYLQLRNGSKVKLLKCSSRDFSSTKARGAALATKVGAPYWAGGPETVVVVKKDSSGFRASYRPMPTDRDFGSLPRWAQGLLLGLLLLVASPFLILPLMVALKGLSR